jgi:hypothetical protein
VAADGSGRVLGEEAGVVLATSRGEMFWRVAQENIELGGCDDGNGGAETAPQGSISRAWLAPREGEGRQKVVDPGDFTKNPVGDLQHAVELAGSIGPYLFIHEETYSYGCGAHGNTTAAFLVWDAEEGKQAELLAEMPNQSKLGRKAEQVLNEADGTPEEAASEGELPALVQIMPVYGPRGGLHVEGQFMRWACYACSDGLWGSYTRSAVLPTGWMPERFSPWVTPPISVREFLDKHPGFRLGGWSRR